jgi:hypothetical protein
VVLLYYLNLVNKQHDIVQYLHLAFIFTTSSKKVLIFSKIAISFLWRPIDNLDFTVQPILFLGFFWIEITNEPSIKPVTKLGSNKKKNLKVV